MYNRNQLWAITRMHESNPHTPHGVWLWVFRVTTCTIPGCFCHIARCNMSQPTKLDIHFHLSSYFCHIASCNMSQPTMLDIYFVVCTEICFLGGCKIPMPLLHSWLLMQLPLRRKLSQNHRLGLQVTCRPRCRMHLISWLHPVRVPAEMSYAISISGALCVHYVWKHFMPAGMSHEFVPRCRFHFLCTIAIAEFQ